MMSEITHNPLSQDIRRRIHHGGDYIVNSQFYAILMDKFGTKQYKYANVKNWSQKMAFDGDIFQLRKLHILVHVHVDNHWILATIDMRLKEIQIYDSKGNEYLDIQNNIKRYLIDEWRDKNQNNNPTPIWKCVPNNKTIPQQQDGFNCGIFVCLYAYFQMKNYSLLFHRSHLSNIRQYFVWSLITDKISFVP